MQKGLKMENGNDFRPIFPPPVEEKIRQKRPLWFTITEK